MQPITCPKCNSSSSQPVTFTWWGGLIGPKLFHLVRCTGCGKSYNGRTGKDVTGGIVVYVIVAALLAAVFFGLILNW